MAITPSPRVRRDMAEQTTYGATSSVAWNDRQSMYTSRQAVDTVARHDRQPPYTPQQAVDPRSRQYHESPYTSQPAVDPRFRQYHEPEYTPRQAAGPVSRAAPPFDGLSAALDRQRGINDPANELREVRRKYNLLKIRFVEAEAQRDTYVRERDRYQDQVREQTKRSRALEQEVAEMKQQMQTEERRHKAMEQDFKAMNDELNRTRATIKIQSETIEGRVDTTLVKTTKDLATRPKQPPAPPANKFGENYGFGIQPVVARSSKDRYDPRESLYEPEPAQQRKPHAGSWKANPGTSTALTIRPQPAKQGYEFPWASQLSGLFLRIEQCCRTYLDLAIEKADEQWPVKLAYDVVAESSVDHVKAIAADPQTRHLLLSRFIVGWISNNYFHSRIARRFSKESDEKVQAIRRQTRPDNSIDVVRTLARAEAEAIEEITKAPGFGSWKDGQLRHGVDTMTTSIQEAIVPGAGDSSPPLDTAFESIVADGWLMGLRMATCTDQFSILFPKSTPSTKFDPRVMMNRDPYITGPPAKLEEWGARVTLGITPHITIKDLLAAKMEEQSVHKAQVLLGWEREDND
ncbi:MAG: hypothetical protein Q9221_006618 [Calogaya cf. arnoldii]